MNSKTMFAPVLDGEALERVEAAFLSDMGSLRGSRPETLLLPVAEIPPVGTHGPAGVDPGPLMVSSRTRRSGCCGGR